MRLGLVWVNGRIALSLSHTTGDFGVDTRTAQRGEAKDMTAYDDFFALINTIAD